MGKYGDFNQLFDLSCTGSGGDIRGEYKVVINVKLVDYTTPLSRKKTLRFVNY